MCRTLDRERLSAEGRSKRLNLEPGASAIQRPVARRPPPTILVHSHESTAEVALPSVENLTVENGIGWEYQRAGTALIRSVGTASARAGLEIRGSVEAASAMGDGGVGQVLGELAQAGSGVVVVGACRADADEGGGA